MKRCFAYSYSKSFQMKAIKESLLEKHKVTKFDKVLHIRKIDPAVDETEGDIFIFPYGVIVTWGLTKELEEEFVKSLTPFLDEHLGAVDDDLYTYNYDEVAK